MVYSSFANTYFCLKKELHCTDWGIFMLNQRNTWRKISSLHFNILHLHFLVFPLKFYNHCCYISALVPTSLLLTKGHATFFWSETIVASFLPPLMLFFKAIFNHTPLKSLWTLWVWPFKDIDQMAVGKLGYPFWMEKSFEFYRG